ncbi:hypothetical protein AB1286_12115 [Trinickia sp. NRRL B-1857]|uniref:hypothetical protein n=1 Tax=Trinickia sp. NRRL B-1857 TaxID=3162879 RepID=UPI003D2A6BF6
MLSKKQWQWLADHYIGVRIACCAVMAVSLLDYSWLVFNALYKKGKVAETHASIQARTSAGCTRRYPVRDPYYLGPETRYHGEPVVRYGESNPFLLQSFRTSIIDIKLLTEDPVCFGASLQDGTTDTVDYVIYLYDKENGKPIYKITRVQ